MRSRTGSLPRSRWRAMDRSSPAAPRSLTARVRARSSSTRRAHCRGVGAVTEAKRDRVRCGGRPSRPIIAACGSGRESGSGQRDERNDAAMTWAVLTMTTLTTCSNGGSPSCSMYASVSGRKPPPRRRWVPTSLPGARWMLPVTLNGPALNAARRRRRCSRSCRLARHSGGMARMTRAVARLSHSPFSPPSDGSGGVGTPASLSGPGLGRHRRSSSLIR